jgi:RNA polymerase sigma-70 factor (ECF subfamily)
MESRSMAVELDEAGLIERARGGDRTAFDALVEAHLTRVWNVVWRILRHREDTEDVVQEVFLTAYRALPDFRGEAKLSTWLQRIAVTRALNHIDRAAEKVRRASRSLDEAPDWSDGEAGGAGPAPDPESTAPSPLQALEASELRRRLAECLGRLPAVWRAVLALRDSEEHSYEQIAAMLRIALGTVRSRLARARMALRRCVEGET